MEDGSTSGTKSETMPGAAVATENWRIEVVPPQVPYPAHCLVQGYKNFKRSAAPSRFLSFRDGSWTDLSRQVLDELTAGFLAGKTAVEATIDGGSYLFDFIRLSQIDLSTGAQRSIAWIDVDGRCFFPRIVVDEQGSDAVAVAPMVPTQRYIPKQEIAVRVVPSSDGSLKRKRDCHEELSVERSESSSSSTASMKRSRWPGTKVLTEGDRFYKVVEKLFITGMRGIAPDTVITSICKCLPIGPSGNSRLQRFQMQMQRMKAARLNANLKFGWYGAPAGSIAGVIADGFGFGHSHNELLGPDAHGAGVHLSPPHSPYKSCVFSETDGDGERHVILCRVIMGNPEKIPAGSRQSHPSCDQFDSGVDDLVNPKWYIVWNPHKTTHIHPEYVVSFKASNLPQARRTSPEKKPVSFVELIPELGKALPSTSNQELVNLHNRLKAGKISKENFIRCIRSIVGDKVLTTILKRILGQSMK